MSGSDMLRLVCAPCYTGTVMDWTLSKIATGSGTVLDSDSLRAVGI